MEDYFHTFESCALVVPEACAEGVEAVDSEWARSYVV